MRHYIGVTNSGPATLRNVRKDETGDPLLLVREQEAVRLRVNFADWLETSETISAATVTAKNCAASISTTSPNCDITISAVTSRQDGSVILKATASTGEIWRGVINVRQPNKYGDEDQIRDYV